MLRLGALLTAVATAKPVTDNVETRNLGSPTQCLLPNGTMAPCGPGNDQCGEPFGRNTPQFHVTDKSCSVNDPNGPVFDPNHKMYHLFYQDHLAIPGGHGPDYGHAVSKDMVKWAHLPVAIWNDQPYDSEAIFTGSATVVDGKVVQVYPGLCDKDKWPNCTTGTNLCIALPKDPSDPLLKEWMKPDYNPIVNGTQRDPSTAWQTPDGEWRLTTFDTIIYGSMDFKNWYKIDEQPNFAHGECPSFFPLPRTTPGAGPAPEGAETPTHVHKASHGGDWMNVGTYKANGRGQNGDWNPTPGVPFEEVKIDMGNFYASKDFYDPVKKRRINWGWAQVPPASTQTLPREVTWNPELQQLVYSPLEEQDQLRGEELANMDKTVLNAKQTLTLGNWADSKGNQSEIFATFPVPSEAGAIGVVVMADEDGGTSTGMFFYANFTQDAIDALKSGKKANVTVGAATGGSSATGSSGYARVMKDTDIAGDDYNVTDVNYKDYETCQKACDDDGKCQAWTYVVRPPKYASCCLKNNIPRRESRKGMISGVKDPSSIPTDPGTLDTLRMSPNDKEVTIRVYTDNTFTETFWQNGRVAMTKTPTITTPALAAVYSDRATTVSVQAWTVDPIWVTPEEILAQL